MNYENLEQPVVRSIRKFLRGAPKDLTDEKGLAKHLVSEEYAVVALPEYRDPDEAETIEESIHNTVLVNLITQFSSCQIWVVKMGPELSDMEACARLSLCFFPVNQITESEIRNVAETAQASLEFLFANCYSVEAFFQQDATYTCSIYGERGRIYPNNLSVSTFLKYASIDSIQEQISKIRGSLDYSCMPNPCLENYYSGSEGCEDYVLDKLDKGSVGLVVGPSGVGKTWVLLDLALSVASGLPALDGLFDTGTPGMSAMFLMEDSRNQIETRFGNLITRRDINQPSTPMLTRTEINRTGLRGWKERRDFIYEHLLALQKERRSDDIVFSPPLRLIVIDPLKEILSGSENDDVATMETMDWIRWIAAKFNCAVMVGHHTSETAQRKHYGSSGGLSQMAVRGHGNITGSARWILNISPVRQKLGEGDISVWTSKVSNGAPMASLVNLQMVNDEGESCLEGQLAAGFSKVPEREVSLSRGKPSVWEVRDKVLASIKEDAGDLTREDTVILVKSKTGFPRAQVRKALDELIQSGKLLREKSGRKWLLALPDSNLAKQAS